MLLKIYYPIPRFPPISLSGRQCQLHCRHCNAVYLRGMRAARTPDALLRLCRQLRDADAVGLLLSGGSDRRGHILNLRPMLDAIRRARAETGLLFNIHPGLMDEATARALAVDFVSLELAGDETIHHVFGLDATAEAYRRTYRILLDAGHHVVPHISVFRGDEDRLLDGLEPPEAVVVLAFTPTPRTPMAHDPPPTPEMIAGVIARARARFPNAEITLGCMRPRTRTLRHEIEVAALEAGVTRMELPAHETLAYATARGYTLRAFDACCALPRRYEPLAQREEL